METILSIAGKPGLYKLVSRGKMNLIVESLDESRKRVPTFASDRVTSLADIAMYTDADDVPLWKVLDNIGKIESYKKAAINYKKAGSKELRTYFAKVLPNFDQDRVHDSDIKKLLQWYDLLIKAGITDFKDTLAPTQGESIEERANEE